MFNPKVLFVADDSRSQKEISRLIGAYYQLVELSYEEEFLLPTQESGSVIVVLLQTSAGKHGIYKLKEVKSEHANVPVILLYTNPPHEDIISAFREGAADVLTMPFPPNDLILRLNNLYEKLKENAIEQGLVPLWILKSVKLARRLWRGIFRAHHVVESSYSRRSVHAFSMIPVPDYPCESMVEGTDIKASFLGNFSVEVKGEPILKKLGKKGKALFTYLLYHHSRPVRREVLIDLFWPDSTPDSAKNCLNVTIHSIRKALQTVKGTEGLIQFEEDNYFINALLKIETDVDLFKRLWRRGQSIEQTEGMEKALEDYNNAIALYKGDFLQNALFDEWTDPVRENLKETYLAILSRLSTYTMKQGRYTQTINLSKKMLAKDDCLEEAHRLLMLSYEKLGMRDKAVRQYKKCREVLFRELEVNPSKRTMEMYNQIRQ